MDPERWKRIDALLSAALAHEEGERASFLAQACQGDEELRKQVQGLLSAHQAASSFLENPPAGAPETVGETLPALGANETRTHDFPMERTVPFQGELGTLERGSALGRYIVLNKLGGGGMGVVYAAYDPELDRKVALKLLRGEAADSKQEGARERLLREAQAMARLSHPNVISVHDVGTFGQQVFIATEFVDGRTLTRWLKEEKRTPRKVLEVFIQAGKGLAAAHAAGLVHRDFKPDNVLVAKEGGVKVLDFGLARAVEDLTAAAPTLPSQLEARGSSMRVLEARLTRTGALMGTPAYMSPEQLLGKTTDARTDQFSFCVALYEALYGERPFEGDSVEVLVQQVTSGKVKSSQKSRRVPGHVRSILSRGLRPNPDERFPSMAPLLQQLSKDPRVFRRRAVGLGGAVLALAAVGTSYRQAAYRHSQLCKGAEQKLVGVWDENRSHAVEASFLATGASFAADAFRQTRKALDEYAHTWVHVQTDACEATRLRGEQSEQLLDLRMECLSQRRAELKALVELFVAADSKLVQRSTQAAESLTPLDGCSDVEALRAPVRPPADPQTRAKVEDLQTTMARVLALHHAGKFSEGLPLATQLVDQARAIHYRSAQAQALHLLGSFQLARGDYKSAEQSIDDAILAAEAGRNDAALAGALITLVWIAGEQDHYQQAHRWAKRASAVIERLGGSDNFEARLFNTLGVLFEKEGKFDEALVHFQRSLALKEKLVGPEHGDIAVCLGNIGMVFSQLGKTNQAFDHLQRALAIREKTLGPTHPQVGAALHDFANVLHRRGEYEEALRLRQRALTIWETALGPLHPQVATSLNSLAHSYRHLGKYQEALAAHQRALAIYEKALGPMHSNVAATLSYIGSLFGLQGKHDQGLEYYRRALAIREKALGTEHPSLSYDLTGIGKEYVMLHSPRSAIAPLERSLSLAEKNPGARNLLAETRFALARALWESRSDVKRARQLATFARDAYAADGNLSKEQLAKVDAWLHASQPVSRASQ